MTALKIEVEPGEVGFDTTRLARIDAHFARYVDDGRLPGWLILVSRAGKIAYLGKYGCRDLEAGAPVEWDTLFRIYSMTKPITSVAFMMLVEEGLVDGRKRLVTKRLGEVDAEYVDQRSTEDVLVALLLQET